MGSPILVFDDHCGFCTRAAYFAERHGGVELVGFTELDEDLREHLPEDYERCSHFLIGGERYSCGASIEQAMLHTWILWPLRPVVSLLRRFPPYNWAREWGYRRVEGNRAFFGRFLSACPPAREECGEESPAD